MRLHLKSLCCFFQICFFQICPWKGSWLRSAALHRIQFWNCCFLFLCYIVTQRLMNHRKIERSYGRCFGLQQLVDNSTEIFISHDKKKKSDSSLPDINKALKPCWLSNWVSIARVVARFSQASLSRPAATAAGQWPEVSDFVACFFTLREPENTQPCENRTRNTRPCENRTRNACYSWKCLRFSHDRVFSGSRNVQNSVTQIIYLGPLPNCRRLGNVL